MNKSTKFKNVYLFAGHGAGDPGATFGNMTEAELTKELRDLVASYSQIKVIKDNDNLRTAQLLRSIGWLEQDLIIDIHFNASSNATANGTEIIIPARSTELERNMADDLCTILSMTMQTRNRGTKSETQTARGRIGILNVSGTNLLIEICFMTNVGDMIKYRKAQDNVAKQIANFILKWAK
jgi:N-acetylmuramoyl-L-alanine amidase